MAPKRRFGEVASGGCPIVKKGAFASLRALEGTWQDCNQPNTYVIKGRNCTVLRPSGRPREFPLHTCDSKVWWGERADFFLADLTADQAVWLHRRRRHRTFAWTRVQEDRDADGDESMCHLEAGDVELDEEEDSKELLERLWNDEPEIVDGSDPEELLDPLAHEEPELADDNGDDEIWGQTAQEDTEAADEELGEEMPGQHYEIEPHPSDDEHEEEELEQERGQRRGQHYEIESQHSDDGFEEDQEERQQLRGKHYIIDSHLLDARFEEAEEQEEEEEEEQQLEQERGHRQGRHYEVESQHSDDRHEEGQQELPVHRRHRSAKNEDTSPCTDHIVDDQTVRESVTRCVQTMLALPFAERRLPRTAAFCFDSLLKGRCTQRRCKRLHERTEPWPSAGFPQQAALDGDFRPAVARALAAACACISEKRCFMVDFQDACLTQALQRHRELILAPTMDAFTASVLGEFGQSVHCTITRALEYAAAFGLEFGCVYLEYPWSLDYFGGQHALLGEKMLDGLDGERGDAVQDVLDDELPRFDGLYDLDKLFEPGRDGSTLLHRDGAVLAVTIIDPEIDKQRDLLEGRLLLCAKQSGRRLERLGHVAEARGRAQSIFFMVDRPPAVSTRRPSALQGRWDVLSGGAEDDGRTIQNRGRAGTSSSEAHRRAFGPEQRGGKARPSRKRDRELASRDTTRRVVPGAQGGERRPNVAAYRLSSDKSAAVKSRFHPQLRVRTPSVRETAADRRSPYEKATVQAGLRPKPPAGGRQTRGSVAYRQSSGEKAAVKSGLPDKRPRGSVAQMPSTKGTPRVRDASFYRPSPAGRAVAASGLHKRFRAAAVCLREAAARKRSAGDAGDITTISDAESDGDRAGAPPGVAELRRRVAKLRGSVCSVLTADGSVP